MTELHSKIGASSMHRWSECPGSVALSKGIESTSSRYAEEGSDAHAFAALCLAMKKHAAYYVGKKMEYAGRQFCADAEMAEHVQVYLDTIWLNLTAEDTMVFEHKFDLSEVHPGLFGTADAVTWKPKEKLLIVDDFKYGAGIPVECVDNPQLMYYALGALLASNYPARTVRMRICQPRCDHPKGPVRHHDIDAIDLVDFKADLKEYAVATEAKDAPLATGDHCRFCPANSIDPKTLDIRCPLVRDKRKAAAKLDFAPVAAGSAEIAYVPAKLSEALSAIPLMESWIKNVREFAYAEAEAGRSPPGYKLVPKRATRKWRSEGDVIEHLQNHPMLDLREDQIFKPRELLSPAQMEKVVKKGSLDEFIVAESSGHTLVPETDKRPEVKKGAKHDFLPVT